MAEVTRDVKMQVPAEKLFNAIVDFDKYPEFLPEVKSAKAQKASGDKVKVDFEIEVMKRFKYTLEFTMKGKEEIAWRLVESDFFKENRGRWVLKPAGENATDVHYELELGFGFMVPGWIVKKLTETGLPKMFENYEARAKSL